MSDSVSFRPMTEEDLDQVMEVEQAAFTHPWSRQLFLDGLSMPSYDCWVMLLANRCIGHGVVQVIADEASLLNMSVAPWQQGRGWGQQLLDHLMVQACRAHAKECFLEVRASNQVAYHLYENYGFNEVGRRRNYYPSVKGREDALVMVCPLGL